MQCGDSQCDNAYVVSDSTKTPTESSCGDLLDNDCDGRIDCGDSDCSGASQCCTAITRDCKAYEERYFKDIHESYYEKGALIYYQGISSQIVDNSFYACPPNTGDGACCTDPNSCVYNGQCYPDGYKSDIDNDGVVERCVAHSPGQFIDDFEIDCANGIDDDFDGSADCDDSDCDSSVNGTVKNQNNEPVSLADVIIKKGLTTVKITSTSQLGDYFAGISCGTYNIVASHESYAPQIKSSVQVLGRQNTETDFNLALGTSCESDCTFVADDIIHASCDGRNGCAFYDDIAKAACDFSQPGWVRDYNESTYISCAGGSPQPKVQIEASVSCSSGTLVKVTRIVFYNGKPVKLVVAACG